MRSIKTICELMALKTVLCQMAANDDLPMDLTQLDILEVHDKAMEQLNQNEDYKKVCMVDKLSELTSYDTRKEVEQALEALIEAKESGGGDEMADFHVDVWQPLENSITVDELLEQITP